MVTPFEDVWALLERTVFPVRSTPTAFNQYRDVHDELDLPDAPARRRQNLRNYFSVYEGVPDVFILAEAPGPWGCRFSGIPITSEAQLLDPTFPISGRRSSSCSRPHEEYSAKIYWRVLLPDFGRFFTWNSVPYHPHKPEVPLSIRTPGLLEIAAQRETLRSMLDTLRPAEVVAVGKRAEYALGRLGQACTYVRHPSQGGSKLFERGMREVFGH